MEKKEETNIARFFVQNKKYLSAAVLVVALIIVLICCLYQNGNKIGDTEQDTGVSSVRATNKLKGKLKKDADPELVTLIHDYYTACANAAIEDLEMLAEPLGENEKSYIKTFSDFYEEYKNITCYSVNGETEDSYLVSVCYDLKFKDIDTQAPGMDFFYVERNGKGKLYINNIYSSYNFNFMEETLDPNLYALILDYEKSDDVTALQKDVETRYEQAVASDEKLANMVGGTLRDAMTQWKKSIISDSSQPADTESSEENPKEDDSQKEDEKQDEKPDKKKTEKVKTKDICRVRKGPSTDDEILGTVDKGVVLTKLGTKGEWTKVEFQGQTGYIKSEFLKAVKSTEKSDKKSDSGKNSGKVKTLDICRVRKAPGTDAEILGTVDVGVELTKLGTEGDWTKVEFQGGTGYIKTEFLKDV